MYGHVNNARYLEFLEEARWSLYESCLNKTSLAQDDFIFYVVNININYSRSAMSGDIIEIHSGIKSIGQRSAIVHQEVFRQSDNKQVASADVTFVMVDKKIEKAHIKNLTDRGANLRSYRNY